MQQLEVPAQRALDAVADVLGLDRRQEADLAEVDGEHRDARARVALQRAQDRAVAAEHHAQLDVRLYLGVQRDARNALEPMLGRLLGVQPQRHARLVGAARKQLQGLARVLGAAVGEHRELPHGSTLRASDSSSRSSRVPASPPSVSQMNVSRLPFGPGSPEEW